MWSLWANYVESITYHDRMVGRCNKRVAACAETKRVVDCCGHRSGEKTSPRHCTRKRAASMEFGEIELEAALCGIGMELDGTIQQP